MSATRPPGHDAHDSEAPRAEALYDEGSPERRASSEGQEVSHSGVRGDLIQVHGVGGNVTIARPVPPTDWKTTGLWAVAIIVVVTLLAGIAIWAGRDSPRDRASPAASPSSRPPLSVVVAAKPLKRVSTFNNLDTYIFSPPASALSPLPPEYRDDQQVIERWAYDNGAVDANYTNVRLVIQGNFARSVVLTDMRIKVLKRDAPPHSIYFKPYPGADGVDGRGASVDLDKWAPQLEDMTNFTDYGNEPWSFPLRVSETEVEVIYLWAMALDHDIQWTVELSFVADGKAEVLSIDNNGKPFRTASSKNSTAYTLKNGKVVPGNADIPMSSAG
ncbi:hypothetical protein [Streptosporangium sp. NBC_01469]|uniref:hypothetical protein n=1 Tax=Streptosporangium sp. NBC_01469 TaxID=2903898 RepID=UPI002E288484|nr:hypothetical protein [Streptosporangium sp. NBC_01469]